MPASEQPAPAARPPLILGIGNILLCDEGVGVHAIERLRQQSPPPEAELIDGGTSGASLLDEVADRPKLIVIDAAHTGHAPGTIVRFGESDLMERDDDALSLHEFGLAETLVAARCIGHSPQEVVIFGVQPRTVAPGLELSEEVTAALPSLVQLVIDELAASG